MKSKEETKGGSQWRGGINDVEQRLVGLMVAGGNISLERMLGLSMTAAMRVDLCFWNKESAISILHILMLRQ